jgi:hypothetical protein
VVPHPARTELCATPPAAGSRRESPRTDDASTSATVEQNHHAATGTTERIGSRSSPAGVRVRGRLSCRDSCQPRGRCHPRSRTRWGPGIPQSALQPRGRVRCVDDQRKSSPLRGKGAAQPGPGQRTVCCGVPAVDQAHDLVPSSLPGPSADQDSKPVVAHGSQGRQVDHQVVRRPGEAGHDRGAKPARIVVRSDDQNHRRPTWRDHRNRRRCRRRHVAASLHDHNPLSSGTGIRHRAVGCRDFRTARDESALEAHERSPSQAESSTVQERPRSSSSGRNCVHPGRDNA